MHDQVQAVERENGVLKEQVQKYKQEAMQKEQQANSYQQQANELQRMIQQGKDVDKTVVEKIAKDIAQERAQHQKSMMEANRKIKELDNELKNVRIDGLKANRGNDSLKDEVKRNVMSKIDLLIKEIK